MSPEKLGEVLTTRAFELEEARDFSTGFSRVVIGQIKNIEKHPNADRLQVVKVDIGKRVLNVICGAFNISVRDKVATALVGAILPNGHIVNKIKIRGVESQGMLCSRKELGIGEDCSGIYVLDKGAKTGENLAKYLKLDDTQLDFDILPNRGHDALSHIGAARDICALENRKAKFDFDSLRLKLPKSHALKIEVEDKNLCLRYIGAVVENVEIKPSPLWMQSRLRVCGIKPVNNIVDITNYVMLELGQPMHSFDFGKIKRETRSSKLETRKKSQTQSSNDQAVEMIIRKAKNGEKIKLLDETEKVLTQNDLVIADSEKPIALAGIMGGLDSAVGENTTAIILESANFDAVSIRKSRVAHNLQTESSYRFEREIDPNLAEAAAARAVELIKKYGGQSGQNARVTASVDIYPKKLKPWKVKLETDYVNGLLGEKINPARVKNILERLGMKVVKAGDNFAVEVPTIRLDLKTQEDLIEEIGRIYGYENIRETAPLVELGAPAVNAQRIFEDDLRNAMTGLGFSEMYNYSFYSREDTEKCLLDKAEHFEVANPMNPDQQFLRTSLIPGLLKNVRLNLKNYPSFSLFEIGRVYLSAADKLPKEKTILAGMLVNLKKKDTLFFELKGKLEALLDKLGYKNSKFEILNSKFRLFWHPTRAAVVKVNNKEIGRVGEINPRVLDKFNIKSSAAVFELKIGELLKIVIPEKQFEPISKYPSVTRDISMFVKKDTLAADIFSKIREAGGNLVLDINLFDISEIEGKKSLAFRIEIGSREKTLTAEEINEVMERVIRKLEDDLRVEVRK